MWLREENLRFERSQVLLHNLSSCDFILAGTAHQLCQRCCRAIGLEEPTNGAALRCRSVRTLTAAVDDAPHKVSVVMFVRRSYEWRIQFETSSPPLRRQDMERLYHFGGACAIFRRDVIGAANYSACDCAAVNIGITNASIWTMMPNWRRSVCRAGQSSSKNYADRR